MIDMTRGDKGKGISQELVAKSHSFEWSRKHDDVMHEILCDILINSFGKAADGKIKSETFVKVIKKFNERTNETIVKKVFGKSYET